MPAVCTDTPVSTVCGDSTACVNEILRKHSPSSADIHATTAFMLHVDHLWGCSESAYCLVFLFFFLFKGGSLAAIYMHVLIQ